MHKCPKCGKLLFTGVQYCNGVPYTHYSCECGWSKNYSMLGYYSSSIDDSQIRNCNKGF